MKIKIRKGLRSFFLTLNLIVVILLASSYMSPYVDPRMLWPFSFLGLIFPYLLIINILFVFFWVMFRKRYLFISLLVLLMGTNFILRVFQLNLKVDDVALKRELTVMSYNVRNFDFYDWRNRMDTQKKFFSLFKNESPDIICFQEFFSLDSDEGMKYIDSLKYKFGYNYYYFNKRVKKTEEEYGIAIFSKYPIINKAKINFKSEAKNGSIFVDLKIDDTVIRVYNLHFQSIQLVHEDYDYIESKIFNVNAISSIVGKVKKAFIKRADQAELISEHINLSPVPVILCGDFNDTPLSYTYQKIFNTRNFKDAFMERGNGFGTTHAGSIPFMRIDNIFVDQEIVLKAFKVIKEDYSDHYPLITKMTY